ncbi:putative SNF2 family N-terminal domain containing protein [Lyophyllum shimeji]|uniref:SNF2 family N-terminal domain containing protein n=1 Tax=Lyophyllum shimeji TaxID=47721 RepID=A0A9P3PIC8_LYOSH|nr:putative SNF2 family N-terminal domain containing protein [Lyophyllum shimeji]
MAAHSARGPFSSMSTVSLPPAFTQHNHIDLTQDEDESNDHYSSQRFAKRARVEAVPSKQDVLNGQSVFVGPTDALPRLSSVHASQNHRAPMLNGAPDNASPSQKPASYPSHVSSSQPAYRPAFAGPSSLFVPRHSQTQLPPSTPPRVSSSFAPNPSHPSTIASFSRQVIDLTGSPSPPPSIQPRQSTTPTLPPASILPPDLPPKTPVCIGQLTVTALVLYPVAYLRPQDPSSDSEWAPVRLQYEHNPHKPGGSETIHIKAPPMRGQNGESMSDEAFGVVEQKVATAIGPMLGKGLIRVDAKVRKGPSNLPILPLQMLVYTPKGNIPVVGNYLRQCGLLLDHPTPPWDVQRLANYHYHNPHDPPPGGHNRAVLASNRLGYTSVSNNSRWTTQTITGKSVEVQRNQVDELFKSLKDGEELAETEPAPEVATKLYPHQKKALTFLLEREREKPGADGQFSSLWQLRTNPMSRQVSWFHIVTQKEVFEEPVEAKGAILADDMGLGKTITCVSLIAATLESAKAFAATPLEVPVPPPRSPDTVSASHFAGSVWGMPTSDPGSSQKQKAKNMKSQERLEAEYARASRIKAKSRATLIVCPLSTVANWEDQFREHWRGEVTVFGGSGATCAPPTPSQSMSQLSLLTSMDVEPDVKSPARVRSGTPLRVYIYHGNARRPDPAFLADFDAVITTFATLASEFSKQNRCAAGADDEEEEGVSSDGAGGVDVDEHGNQVLRLPKAKKGGLKRKKSAAFVGCGSVESASALQSIHWFRVVLDEAHSIKETGTVASRASCDLMADRRLCLTGTPVQNKLDDVFALIKFLRLDPFDDKNVWTEFIGSPVKFGQTLGVARLQTIMKCITLRRTKETKTQDGKKILALPPRRDELRYLKFDAEEQAIYDQFFNESKAEFTEMSTKNEVMKNYVGILQKILRLRQICDHFELVQGKGLGQAEQTQDSAASHEDIVADIEKEGLNAARAAAIFALLRESTTTQCVECGGELCVAVEAQADGADLDGSSTAKRGRKGRGTASRGSTRASSPTTPRPILTRCQHLFCLECYRNSICPGWPNVAPDTQRSCSACQTALSLSDAVEIKPELSLDIMSSKKKPQKREKRAKGASTDFHPSTKVKALLGDLVMFSRANPYSANYDPSSIEVQMIDNQGNQLDDGVVKTVVFSQWTSMLDKVEDALEAAGIRYDRLDGTMKRDDRTRAMDALKHDPGCEVLLVSLKAGGVGLNLTAAQRVYLMDPYWNPAVENQAVDRIHRLGQTRPVTTVKLIIENSIEARLLEVQKKKTELANMTLGQNFSKADLLQRRMEELNQLFGS